MKRIYFLVCVLCLMSCQDKVICPAFQSTYILDDSTRNAYFSYVWQLDEITRAQFLAEEQSGEAITNDSSSVSNSAQPQTDYYAYAGEKVVPWRVSARTKYGIIKPGFMPIKKYRMRTAPMENVFAPDPPATNVAVDSPVDLIASDSLGVSPTDTLAVASLPGYEEETKNQTRFLYGYDPADNFNVEQQYYNKYFSDQLIDTTPPQEKPQPVATDSLSIDSTESKQSFIKGLFKKKNKKQPDTESEGVEEEPVIEETSEDEGNG